MDVPVLLLTPTLVVLPQKKLKLAAARLKAEEKSSRAAPRPMQCVDRMYLVRREAK